MRVMIPDSRLKRRSSGPGVYVGGGYRRHVRRYWKIYRTFFLSSLARELEFRANFFAKIIQNAVWTLFFIVILLVIYGQTDSVAGWSRGESFVLAGTVFFIDAVMRGIFFSLLEIPESVRKGTLDFVVTKPIDSQFWVSTRRFSFEQLGVMLAACGMVVAGVIEAGLSPTVADWAGYTVLALAATLMYYGFNLFLMTLAIWFVRVDNLWVLSDTVIQIARYPTDMYSFLLQKVFLWALPLAFLATVPARQLRSGFDLGMVALGIVWAAVLLMASRAFWAYAMRNYGSASS